MCGINGILRLADTVPAVDQQELLRTRDAMRRRGPDAEGMWIAPNGDLGLGHRRLAIIDLSPDGVQPMSWANGRYHIVFNGEIYNYRELRADLVQKGVHFRSTSDTEVILALFAREGIDMLGKLRGMFAFGLWDEQEKRLLLARDPNGIKPLYYSLDGGYLRFASQVKALETSGAVSRAVDPAAVVGFLLWGSVPEPFTIRQAIRALPAGHFLVADQGNVGQPQAYPVGSNLQPADISPAEALSDSVRAHLVADVPVAIFLSAGLDSSLIAALASRNLPEPPTTLTVRFESFAGTSYDEGPLAAKTAHRLGAHHIDQTVGAADFPHLWVDAMAAMDQPSIDGFNTYVVSAMASRAGFKVVLSGLGGDELFGGYASFQDVPRWARWTKRLGSMPGMRAAWPHLAGRLRPAQPKLHGMMRYGGSVPGAYFLRRGLYLPEELPGVIDPDLAAAGLAAYDPVQDMQLRLDHTQQQDVWLQVQQLEWQQYMRNQLLRDADWASMAHSLELRVPLVDSTLYRQLAARRFEPARSRGKAALVRQAAPELPAELWTRPKTGFHIPVHDWLEDRQSDGKSPHWGRDSRQLALKVLRQFM